VTEGLDYSQRFWEDVRDGEQLPAVVDDITYRRVIMNTAATWDYFPGHHDPEYARSQGQPTIYLNTIHLMGFVDRVVTGWAGGRAFVVRRRVSVRRSVYAGDRMVGEGVVTARRREQDRGLVRHLVDVDVVVRNQHGEVCCPASVTVELPARSPGRAP
jgi:acyl dehydratase